MGSLRYISVFKMSHGRRVVIFHEIHYPKSGVKATNRRERRIQNILVWRGSPPPYFVCIFLALGFRHAPEDESKENGSESGKEIKDATTIQRHVEDGEELGDEKSGDPASGQSPGLGSADRFLTDELGREDKGDGTKPQGVRDDEEERRNGRENTNGEIQRDGKQEGIEAHAGHGQKQARFATDAIGERCTEEGDDEVDGRDADGDGAGFRGE